MIRRSARPPPSPSSRAALLTLLLPPLRSAVKTAARVGFGVSSKGTRRYASISHIIRLLTGSRAEFTTHQRAHRSQSERS
mmetsp:Transcript_66699/g.182962  ORF Transcript_66699/g.182962 Transcript_66699/m.182962 type:complete len:80 (-) Transcript_66699:179-418(-)